MNILFVCTGNTCRSAMAEGLARQLLPEHNISSAGIFADNGDGASPAAIEVMREAGADISAHRSRRVTEEMLGKSDLILCMTRGHESVLNDKYDVKDKTFTLGRYADGDDSGGANVDDPYGMSAASYRVCRDILRGMIEKAAEKIKNES